MKPAPTLPDPEGTPFERFDKLFRAVSSVPKADVEKAEAEERRKNQTMRTKRKKAVQREAQK